MWVCRDGNPCIKGMKMRNYALRMVTGLCLIALLCGAASAADAAKPSAVGQWRLNIKKSDFGRTPAPRSILLTVTKGDSSNIEIEWTATGVDASGKKISESFQGKTDGVFLPVQGANVRAAYMWEGDTLVEQFERPDHATTVNRITFSADGKQMVGKATTKSPKGLTYTTEVFDRQ